MIAAAGGIAVVADRSALHALLRVRRRALVGALGDAHAFHPDGEACEVHHDEHVLEAAILLAHEISNGATLVTIRQHGRGARVNAELVLERDAVDVVARAEAAVGVDQEFRHDEQRDALDALGRVGRAREHEVDDVLGVIVLAVSDEDLLAEELVRAVTLRHGARAHGGEIGARLRLGQVHRAGPRAGHHLLEVELLQGRRAAEVDGLDRALGQHRDQVEREVRRMPHLLDRRAEKVRQPLAAVLRRLGEPVPAVGAELQVRVLESRGRLDRAVVLEARSFAIAADVERVEHVRRELGGLVEDRRRDVGRRLLVARQRARPGRDRQPRSARSASRRAARGIGSSQSPARMARRHSSAAVNAGTIWNRSPTRP